MIVLTVDRPALMKAPAPAETKSSQIILKISKIFLLQLLLWDKLAEELLKISENFLCNIFCICTELGNSTLHYAQLRPHCARKTPLSENIFAVPRDRYVTLTSPPKIAYSCANIGFCAEIYKLSFPEKSPFKFLLLLRCLGKMKHFHDFSKNLKKCGQG